MQGRDRSDAWRSANQAWGVIGTLLSGILVWGGVGYVIDRSLGFERHLFLPAGMLLGVAAAFYLVYRRYGTEDR